MKLALLLNNLAGGGAERVAVTVANTMSRMGHDVSLVLNQARGPYLTEVANGIRVLELGRRMLLAIPPLVRLLRRERFDAVITILDQPSIGCLLVRPFIGKTAVVVVECNNPLADGDVKGLAWRLIRWLRPWLYPRADHIVTKSEGIRACLVSRFGCHADRVTAISNPVDVANIEAAARDEVNHPWFQPDRDAPVLLAMGRLSVQKGFETLLRAFARLRAQRPVNLVVLGEGCERERLEGLVRELALQKWVELPGFAKNPYAFVARADCFAMSSLWEGWPNALVEALACGTPVVSTDCESGPREILQNGAFGRLVPVGDEVELAAAIDLTLSAPRDGDRLKGRVTEFTPESVVRRYISVMESVVYDEN